MRALPAVVVAAVVAASPVAAQDVESLLEEVGRSNVLFFAGLGTEGRCSISAELLTDEIVRVLRRYSIPGQPAPPPPDSEIGSGDLLEWVKTPYLNVDVTGLQADRYGQGCAFFVTTELSVGRVWIPRGFEDLVGAVADEEQIAGSVFDVLRILSNPAHLRASRRGTLLIAPRDERGRDVQRVVETHVSEIAEAINRAR